MAADQLDLFGGAAPMVSEPGHVVREERTEGGQARLELGAATLPGQQTLGTPSVEPLVRPTVRNPAPAERVPLQLMRHMEDGSTWRGPGGWFHLRYFVLGITTAGPDNPVEQTDYAWFPGQGAALTEAARRNTAGGKVSVKASEPGYFAWIRSKAWALASAGYPVYAGSNGHAWLCEPLAPEIEETLTSYERLALSWNKDRIPDLGYIGDAVVDAMLRARGVDPLA